MKRLSSQEQKSVKILLSLNDLEVTDHSQRLVLCAGKSGRFNLLGGGVEIGETPLETLNRELSEEASITLDEVTDLCRASKLDVQGETVSADGQVNWTKWAVYTGQLAVHSSELHVPSDSDITAIVTGTPRAILEDNHTSLLAKNVLLQAHPNSYTNQPDHFLRTA